MNRLNLVLTVLLVAQAGLLSWRNMRPDTDVRAEPQALLADLKAESVSRIVIEDSDDKELVLEKTAEGWVLPGIGGYPAAAKKVDEIVADLAGLKVRHAVAETQDHHHDMEVAESNFRKRVKVSAGDQEDVLFLGTTGRAGGLHVRKGGQNAVFAARDLDDWRFSTRTDSWIDVVAWDLGADRVTSVRVEREGNSLDLRKEGTAWLVSASGAAAAPVDPSKAEARARKAARLTFTDVAGKRQADGAALGTVLATVSITVAAEAEGGSPTVRTLQVAAVDGDSTRFRGAIDGHPWVLSFSSWALEDLIDLDPSKLQPDPPAPEPAPSDPADPHAGVMGFGH